MENIILNSLYTIFSKTINILPGDFAAYPGIFLGKTASILTSKRKERSVANIKEALDYQQKDAEELMEKVYRFVGITFAEFLKMENLSREELLTAINFIDQDYLAEAFNKGNGVIIYSAHFGNWELMAAAMAAAGYPTNAIARSQNNSKFDQKINQIRSARGVNIIPKGVSVRKAYQVLKRGEILLILGDQDARDSGWKMDFFDRPASTYHGAVQLAARTGALIVPAFLLRRDWFKHDFICQAPVQVAAKADQEEQKIILQELVDQTEKMIRKYPDHWMWLHRRWKTY